jgi:hypothetical protein
MRTKTFSIGEYEVTMSSPKHGDIMDADTLASKQTSNGVPFINEREFEFFCIAASIKSIKHKVETKIADAPPTIEVKELGATKEDVIKFLRNDLEDAAWPVLREVYKYVNDATPYVEILKNLRKETSQAS